jgi:deazaflavin-dependent oxidoreductase (nitroreductase family)
MGDAPIFAAALSVALRLAFSTVNEGLGSPPDAELVQAAPVAVRQVVSFGRPSGPERIHSQQVRHTSSTTLVPVAVRAYEEATRLQRALRRFGASAAGSRLLRPTLHHVDAFVHRLSGGRITLATAVGGIPTAMLTTTGARTGKPRTVPVLAVDLAGGWGLIASSFGQEQHPGWYYNLLAHPDAVLEVGGERMNVVARLVHGAERDTVRAAALSIYPGYSVYEKRASHRTLGYFVLTRA